MDPVTIISMVGSCATLASRIVALIDAIPKITEQFRGAQLSAKNLTSQLGLFNETVTELREWLKRRNPSEVSQRAKTSLKTSLGCCEDVLAEIEAHVQRLRPDLSQQKLSIFNRIRYVWDEEKMRECERRVTSHLQTISIYINVLKL
jgi:hypothetical protein